MKVGNKMFNFKANKSIKVLLIDKNITQQTVAKQLGITEFTLCRWLSKEIPPEKKNINYRSYRKNWRRVGVNMTDIQVIINDKELAKLLDSTGKIVTPWTIRNWRLQGGMPSFSVGKRIFFRLESVLAWIDNKEKGKPEPMQEYGKIRKLD